MLMSNENSDLLNNDILKHKGNSITWKSFEKSSWRIWQLYEKSFNLGRKRLFGNYEYLIKRTR